MLSNRFPTTPSVPRRTSQLQQQAICLRPPVKAARHRLCNAASPAANAQTAGPAAAAVVRPISSKPNPLDPSTGYVTTEADPTKVPDSFRQLLSSLVTAYQSACGSRLVGVYLRGSLPRGLFLPGISDVDTFAVVLPVITSAVQNSSSSSDAEAAVSSTSSSRNDSLQDLQQAVKRLSEPAVQAHQQLGYTKVEVKVLQVEPNSPATATLTALLQQQQQQQDAASSQRTLTSVPPAQQTNTTTTTSSSIDGYLPHNGSEAVVLRPAMSSSVPYAFELKTASVCLAGLDLPQLLHPSAALPPQYEVVPDLASSVEAARAAAAAAAATAATATAAAGIDGCNAVAAAEQEAVAAGAAVGRHIVDVQVRATKWALKRLLRGAFELAQDRAGCYTQDLYWCCQAAKQHIPELQQQLSWTLQPGNQQQQQQQQQQQWHEQLDSALQLYVSLQSALLQYQQYQQQTNLHLPQHHDPGPGPHAAAAAAAAGGGLGPSLAAPAGAAAAAVLAEQQHLQQLIDSSWQLVDVLLPKLDTLFLKAMLVEEPGWLTQHTGYPIPASPGSGSRSSSDVFSSSNISSSRVPSQQRQQQQQQSPWLFAGKALKALQGVLSPAAAAAAGSNASAASAITQVLGAVPPVTKIPVMGQIQAYDWQQEEARAAGAAAVRQILSTVSSSMPPPTNNDRSNCSNSSRSGGGHNASAGAEFELLGSWPRPVVLRGAAATWPCVTGAWDLDWLAQQGIEGKVRVAPSLQFPFVEPQLLEILLKLRGVKAAPSILTDMSASEFVQRLQPGCCMPPIAYTPTECYYWQADLPQHLKQQEQLDNLLKTFSGTRLAQQQQKSPPQQQPTEQQEQVQEQDVAVTQQPRLWVSPAGAVSPLHYDKSHSFLLQVTGTKRMLFFSPDQLHRLYCYPDTHILRRRSRVSVSSPDLARSPLFAEAAALEVVLHPGEVVCFPSYWSHYTESVGQGVESSEPVGCSMSITFRCQATQG